MSEIDGFDPTTGETIELKATRASKISIRHLMQIMTNGSSRIVSLAPNKTKDSFLSMTMYNRDELLKLNETQWISVGQRIRYLLPRILDNHMVQNATDHPVIMTFDECKLPQFAPAPADYSLIPPDFACNTTQKRSRHSDQIISTNMNHRLSSVSR